MQPLLEIQHLTTSLFLGEGEAKAVHDVSLTIGRGESVALVGESGCGKSMTALSILKLIPDPPARITAGKILYHSQGGQTVDLVALNEKQIRPIRGNRIAMIFQEPMTSLNPVFTIGNQIAEAIILHQKVAKGEARKRTLQLLDRVKIPAAEQRIDEYPHQLSGGMRQRVMIAMALACKPDLLIADEPTTALDVTIQAQIMSLICALVSDMGMSLLLITHDLGIVAQTCQRVLVMYAGRIVEEAETTQLYTQVKHPYTHGLLAAVSALHHRGGTRLKAIPGVVPPLTKLPVGCSFADRCEFVQADCHHNMPELTAPQEGHGVRCFHPL